MQALSVQKLVRIKTCLAPCKRGPNRNFNLLQNVSTSQHSRCDSNDVDKICVFLEM